MSFWYRDADLPSNFTAAGGVAGLGEIVDAASKQMRMVDNTNAAGAALFEAYDRRIADIARATGQKIENPLLVAERLDREQMQRPRKPMYEQPLYADELKDGPPMPTNSQREAQKFSTWLAELEQRFPEHKAAIRADVPVEKDAQAIAKASDDDLARMMASSPGAGKWAAALYGGFKGSLYDPLQVATLFAGGGPAAGRSVAARIASVALKEALVNGAVEAAFQPTVQAWREKAGLPNGWAEGAKNVLFAAAAGGVLGGGAEALAAGGRRLFTGQWLDQAAEHAARTAPLTPEVKAGIDGDLDAAVAVIAPIRDALPAEARAAIDLTETLDLARRELPDVAAPVVHARNLDLAQRVAEDPVSYAPDFELDRAKIDRIVAELVPDAPGKRRADALSLQEFLIRAGGVQDQKGEISALGLQNASQKFKGRLVREDGRSLDYARELAAESGYFNHRYGTSDEAVAKSTVADLLDELDAGSRRVDGPDDDGGRAYVEGRVEDLLRQVGPEVDEKLIARAVSRAEREGIDLVEAFDAEAIAADRNSNVLRVDKTERLSDAEHAALDALLERDLRSRTSLSREEQAIIDRSYAENGPSSEAIANLIEQGTYPAPRDLVLYRGEQRQSPAAGEFVSMTFSPYTARGFAGPEGRVTRDLVPKGTQIYSPRSGISGGEVLVRQGSLEDIRRADPLALPEKAPEPDAIDEEQLFDMADLEDFDPEMAIPFFDDAPPVRAGDVIADIEATHAMQRATELCRIP